MRARIVAALVGAAAAVSLLVVPASAEEGGSDTRPCVTRNEFEAVSDGYSKERVNGIFDSDGNLYGTVTEGGQVVQKSYAWNPCTDAAEADDYVSVEFKKECANCALRVFAKHWYVD
jgi:hypothetical protein